MVNHDSKRARIDRRISTAAGGWLLLLLTCQTSAWATSGNQQVAPTLANGTPAFSRQSGLQITVDTSWAGDRGYRPVRITVTTTKPANAESLLTVKFHAGGWRRSESIVVEQDFQLPQGATSATTMLLAPQYSDWNYFGWEVWVDGRKDDELSLEQTGFNTPGNAELAAVILPSGARASSSWVTNYLQQFAGGTPDIHSPTAAELPNSWVAYSELDVVVAYPETLLLAATSSPDRFAELLRWVRAGGNLWVFDVGRDFSHIDGVQATLGLPSAKETSSLQDRGWQIVPLSDKPLSGTDALIDLNGLRAEKHEPTPEKSWRVDPENLADASDSQRWFVARPFGMGTITAFQDPYGRPWDSGDSRIRAVERSSLSPRLHWAARHGNDPSAGNPNFNDWLIPDVGHAPVLEFQLLISLFVLGIGPLNYWVLKRRNELPLLLITVPVAAVATTLLLFAYGFLVDGFGVKVRARSLTMLDQRAGEAACWTRLSYYAGIAPGEGLQMPTDTVVYPIASHRGRRSGIAGRYTRQQREMVVDREQHLTRGWLGSRTPTQYLSITARPSSERIEFVPQGDSLLATNHLGVKVLALLVEDHEGQVYAGESIDVDATTELANCDRLKALMMMRTLLSENEPQFPPGYQPNRRSWRNDAFVTPLSNNLMETQLSAIISPIAESWGKGSYVAVTEKGVEVSLGAVRAVETDSFHVIRGAW